MIPKKPAPDLIRGVQWFSEKISNKSMIPKKPAPDVMPAKAGIQ
jgi:hypothetical protein